MAQDVKTVLSSEKPWYKNGWIILILIPVIILSLPFLFFLSPIIALALIWNQKKWSRNVKVGSSVAVAAVVLLFVVSSAASNSGDKIENNKVLTEQPQQVSEVAQELAAESVDLSGSSTTVSSVAIEAKAPVKDAVATTNFYLVTAVVDGDTFKVSIDGKQETIRLIGIDTPETVDPRKAVQCFGIEASNKAKALLTGKKVRLEADSTQGELDKYGRLLRYAFLEDGTFFSKLMISDGYAREYTYNSAYKYQADFKQAEAEAKIAKRGLWADDACPVVTQSTPTPTPTPIPEPTPTPTPSPTPTTGHVFYVSSYYSAKVYYCDTDAGWKTLSKTYLKSFPSAEQLLATYPGKTLHEPCK